MCGRGLGWLCLFALGGLVSFEAIGNGDREGGDEGRTDLQQLSIHAKAPDQDIEAVFELGERGSRGGGWCLGWRIRGSVEDVLDSSETGFKEGDCG